MSCWRQLTRPSTKVNERTCHFLICKDSAYAKISKYAIYSYLRFNPNSHIVIHCDSKTYSIVKWMYRWPLSGAINVIEDIDYEEYPYISKGILILKLQGTSDIFLDVDTRINGTLPVCTVPTALVAEFRIADSAKFSSIFRAMGHPDFQHLYLLNVTFVSWGGHNLNLDTETFSLWSDKYLNLPWHELMSSDAIPYFKRFVEQTFFSEVFQRGKWGVLKSSDFVGDQGLVESSYYGASGYRFGT